MRSYDRYKKKKCERCGKIHRKRGKYCSQSCASRKPASETRKARISDSIREYYRTEDGIAKTQRQSGWASALNQFKHGYSLERPEALSESDYYIEVPTERPTLRDNQFIEGGDLWEEI